jgi:hypothetical protein
MVFSSGIRRAHSQLQHVLAQAGGRGSLLQAPLVQARLFFDVEAYERNHRPADPNPLRLPASPRARPVCEIKYHPMP